MVSLWMRLLDSRWDWLSRLAMLSSGKGMFGILRLRFFGGSAGKLKCCFDADTHSGNISVNGTREQEQKTVDTEYTAIYSTWSHRAMNRRNTCWVYPRTQNPHKYLRRIKVV